MKNTMKAKIGYLIKKLPDGRLALFDGIHALFTFKIRFMEDYIDECANGNNECALKMGVLTTRAGNQFIYWCDEETGEDFLTEVTI